MGNRATPATAFYAPIRLLFATMLGCLTLAGLCAWLLVDAVAGLRGTIAAAVGITLFGGITADQSWELLTRGPVLVLTDEGLRHEGLEHIAWSEISHIELRHTNSRQFIDIVPNDPVADPSRFRAIAADRVSVPLDTVLGSMQRHHPTPVVAPQSR